MSSSYSTALDKILSDRMDIVSAADAYPHIVTDYGLSGSTLPFLEWVQMQKQKLSKTGFHIFPEESHTVPELALSEDQAAQHNMPNLVDQLRVDLQEKYLDLFDRVMQYVDLTDFDNVGRRVDVTIPPFLRVPYSQALKILTSPPYSVPLHMVLDALLVILSDEDIETQAVVHGFALELQAILSEDAKSQTEVDTYIHPVSEEDRLWGTVKRCGERAVPASQIHNWTPSTNPRTTLGRVIPVKLYRYGEKYFFANVSDKSKTGLKDGTSEVQAIVYSIIPGSSRERLLKKAAYFRLVRQAIRHLLTGQWSRILDDLWQPRYAIRILKSATSVLRKNITRRIADTGISPGYALGDLPMSQIHQDTADGCGGCTWNAGTGSTVEFGYGTGGGMSAVVEKLYKMLLDKGFNVGEFAPYNSERTPGQGTQ